MSKIRETTLEINLQHLEHNYRYFKERLDSKTRFLAVVKAFAYGSDMVAVAQKLQGLGADYFAVAYVKEGVLLREAGITAPILVLHPQPPNFGTLLEHCLEPSIYSNRVLTTFLKLTQEKKLKDYPVHIKINTGLNRLGFDPSEVPLVSQQLRQTKAIKVKWLFSHLVASEDQNERSFSLNQIRLFNAACEHLAKDLGYMPMRHLLNTSGIINYPEAQFDMVRSGIGLYGYGNQAEIDTQLKPIATLKTVISQLHQVSASESVGYNRAYIAQVDRVTATLPLGHADGIGRLYGGGKTCVFINGKQAPIIGNVCMDMIMIDVTGIDCNEGDEVIVFGGHSGSAERFAQSANTISYEILTAVSQRVTRKILGKF